jgi:hypothetical protein
MRDAVQRADAGGVMTIVVHGMQGLGDCIHQRAIMRQLMRRDRVVLETPWPCVYHDLAGERLTLMAKPSALRVQTKNIAREAARFDRSRMPAGAPAIRVWYTGERVRAVGSILGAMLEHCGCDPVGADFRLPLPRAWGDRAAALIQQWHPRHPIMVYRPLIERTEWKGCAVRNPDFATYARLFETIRNQFFVVSVADLVDGVEWIAGERIRADIELHAGELDFETMAALFARASLVFGAAGFAPVLAQAIGTPSVTVFGGHEASPSISGGAAFAPTLGIDPVHPCMCFRNDHACDKQIDVPAAIDELQRFIALDRVALCA